nr:MAG TPA: minor tail protein [Caudoviricetes sp.]
MAVDGSLNFDTKIDSKGFDKGVKNINSSVSQLSSGLGALKTKIAAAFSVAAIVAFGKQALETAASVNAANSAMSQTFGEFEGAASAAISRVADESGILETRLKSLATGIYAFAKTSGMDSASALGMMKEALQVAADSAAYYDRSLEDTSETLKSFLKGNYANDAALGLSATEYTRNAAAMKLYGKSFQNLSEAQKQLTLLQMVKDANDLSGATGQAAREADGWENVIGNLKEAWKQLIAVIGQPVLKLAIPVVQSMTATLQRMTEVANAAWQALQKIFGWEDADAIKSATKAQEQLTSAVEETSDAQKGALAGFDEIQTLSDKTAETATASAGADTPVEDLANIADKDGGKIPLEFDTSGIEGAVKTIQTVVGRIKAILSSLARWAETTIKPQFGKLFDAIAPALPAIQTKVQEAFSGLSGIASQAFAGVRTNIETMFSDVGTLAAPLGEYFTTQLPDFISAGITSIGTILLGLLDTFNMIFADILEAAQPFAEGFTSTVLPVLTEFGTQALGTLTQVFGEVKDIFDSVWEEGIAPFFKRIGKYWNEAWESVKAVWKEHGQPIFDGINKTFKNMGDILKNVWELFLKPVWENFIDTLDWLWEQHLKPLWDQVLEFVASLIECATAIYNNAIAPIGKWLQAYLYPIVANVVNTIWNIITRVAGFFIDVIAAIIQACKGVTEFLAGVFTLDFQRALDGLNEITNSFANVGIALFEGAVNIIIDLINGMINGVVTGINFVIKALNSISFDIPDWVPLVGGKHFGVNLSPLTAPQIPKLSIPRLATGAVIPPNREFLAVLGDQKQGTNIEAPLETIKQAFREALAESGGSGRQMNVVLQVGRRELARTVVELSREEQQRVGMRIRTV